MRDQIHPPSHYRLKMMEEFVVERDLATTPTSRSECYLNGVSTSGEETEVVAVPGTVSRKQVGFDGGKDKSSQLSQSF